MVVIGDADGNVVASAHAYMPHNAFRNFRRFAWEGLIAVVESQHGKRLGNYVNARAVERAVRNLGAMHVYEFEAARNIASCRMVESCGWRHTPALLAGIAVASDGVWFTR